MKIMKYIFFNSSEEFENWQREQSRNVMQLSPIMRGMDLAEKLGENSNESSASVGIGLFVNYYEEE